MVCYFCCVIAEVDWLAGNWPRDHSSFFIKTPVSEVAPQTGYAAPDTAQWKISEGDPKLEK